MIKINGEMIDAQELPLADWLKDNGYTSGRIAVECNEMIVPKAVYAQTILHDGDVVEIVSLVGGG